MPYVIQRNGKIFAKLSSQWIKRYRLRSTDGSELPAADDVSDVAVPILGGGGFGVVVRATDDLDLSRAVKLVSAEYVIAEPGHTDLLRQEITLTTSHPLKHTIPILDYGFETDDRNETFWFYVMPFVAGKTLDVFFRDLLQIHGEGLRTAPLQRGLMRDLLLSILGQVTAGLVELADFSIVHMDISPTNIMVYVPDASLHHDLAGLTRKARAFLIDLGAAKRLVPGRRGETIFIRHRYYFPEEIETELGAGFVSGRSYQVIRYENLARFGSLIDLYSFGRVLEVLLLNRAERKTRRFSGDPNAEKDKEALWRQVLGPDFFFLRDVVDRLLQIRSPVYRDPSACKEVVDTLRPTTSWSLYDSTLLTDRYPGAKIRAGQPLVKLAPPLERVVSHPIFQRLKRLRQLTLLDEVFPGATHSRFTHSLQTFDLMKRYLFSLGRLPEFRLEFQRRHIDETLVAALVHDIGQYPFSHSVEDLRKMGDDFVMASLQQHTEGLIDGRELQRRETLAAPHRAVRHDQELALESMERAEAVGGQVAISIKRILEDHGVDLGASTYMFQKTEKDWSRERYLNVGRDLVAGTIDADRLAYLIYDSQQTGVPFGLAVDVGTLVEGLTVRLDGGQSVGLGIEEGAVSAVEAVVAAVYWMYQNVYWHHANRGFMAAVKFVMSRLLESNAMDFAGFLDATFGLGDFEALRWLTDQDARLDLPFRPLASLVTRRRLGYKRVYSLGHQRGWYEQEGDKESKDLDAIAKRKNDLYEALVRSVDIENEKVFQRALAACIPCGRRVEDGEILLDIPLKPRLRWARPRASETATVAEAGERTAKLWVKRRRLGSGGVPVWNTLREVSELARTLGEMEDTSGRKIRVFVARSLFAALTESQVGQLEERVERALIEAAASEFRAKKGQTTLPLAAANDIQP